MAGTRAWTSILVDRAEIPQIARLWPGLPQLWLRGSWAGLVVAVGFTALANVLLLATLVYDQWIDGTSRLLGLGVLVALWVVSWWQSGARRYRHLSAEPPEGAANEGANEGPRPDRSANSRDLWFREAQQRYLASDWVAAEQLLLKLLKQDSRDVESRLMLATLWRHQGRRTEAARQLDRLERFEAAEKWKHEIEAERIALDNAVLQDDPIATNDTTNKRTPHDSTTRRAA